MMKELEKIKRKLREHKPDLKEKYNVEEIGIFGSYVHSIRLKAVISISL